ncbi:hypothetical protein EDB85DRAFT_2140491 [Lactarius pseudohatsudake]|nr:hypothetical protein EDB85DRAFT_2140491 [Lactarius pseudohatsudake]
MSFGHPGAVLLSVGVPMGEPHSATRAQPARIRIPPTRLKLEKEQLAPPSTVVGVESDPEAAAAEEGIDPDVLVETGAEIAALETVEGGVEADTELKPEADASTIGEVAAREPEDELATIVVEEPFAVENVVVASPYSG